MFLSWTNSFLSIVPWNLYLWERSVIFEWPPKSLFISRSCLSVCFGSFFSWVQWLLCSLLRLMRVCCVLGSLFSMRWHVVLWVREKKTIYLSDHVLVLSEHSYLLKSIMIIHKNLHSFLNAIIWQFNVILEVKSNGNANFQPFATRLSVPFQLNALTLSSPLFNQSLFCGLASYALHSTFSWKKLEWPRIIWFLCSMLIIPLFMYE